MSLFLYLATIVVSNLVTVVFPPTHLGFIVVPPSAYFMGFSFIFGNLLQDKYGSKTSKYFIWVGLAISAVLFVVLGYSQSVVIASGTAFIVSQLFTNILYTRLKKSSAKENAMIVSSICGSLLDVTLFVVIGLSPIGLGTLHGIDIVLAIIGQFAVQTVLQLLAKKVLEKFYYAKQIEGSD